MLFSLFKLLLEVSTIVGGVAGALDILDHMGVDTHAVLMSFGSELGGVLVRAEDMYSVAVHHVGGWIGSALHLSSSVTNAPASTIALWINVVLLSLGLLITAWQLRRFV